MFIEYTVGIHFQLVWYFDQVEGKSWFLSGVENRHNLAAFLNFLLKCSWCENPVSALTQHLFSHCSSTVVSGSWGCCLALKPHSLFAELSVAHTLSQQGFTSYLHLQICYVPNLGEGLIGKHWKRDLEKGWEQADSGEHLLMIFKVVSSFLHTLCTLATRKRQVGY